MAEAALEMAGARVQVGSKPEGVLKVAGTRTPEERCLGWNEGTLLVAPLLRRLALRTVLVVDGAPPRRDSGRW